MTADAPRFRAFWEHVDGRSVLTMSRSDWSGLSVRMGQPVRIDVDRTPMAQVAKQAHVVRALAEQRSGATAQIAIIRYDEKDAPTPYNQDKYTVWLDVLRHPSVNHMISAASTELNQNFVDFAAQNVFIIKQDPSRDHWLPSIPGSATTVVRTT